MKTWKKIAIYGTILGALNVASIFGALGSYRSIFRYSKKIDTILDQNPNVKTAWNLKNKFPNYYYEDDQLKSGFFDEKRIRKSQDYLNNIKKVYEGRLEDIEEYEKVTSPEVKERLGSIDGLEKKLNFAVGCFLISLSSSLVLVTSILGGAAAIGIKEYMKSRKTK